MKRAAALYALFLLLSFRPAAQCPGSRSLWKQIEQIRSNKELDNARKREKFLKLLEGVNRCALPPDSSVVSLYQRIGAVEFNLNNLPEAVLQTQKAIDLYNAYPAAQVPSMKPQAFFNLAMMYKASQENELSFRAFDSCLAFAGMYPATQSLVVLSYKNLANTYFQLGDYARALNFAERSLIEATKQQSSYDILLALIEKGMALSGMNRYPEALEVTRAAIELNDKNPYPYADETGNLYSVRASIERKLNRPDEALKWYDKSIRCYADAQFNAGILVALNNTGDTYLHDFHEPQKAFQYFTRAFAYAASAYDSLRLYNNVGDVLAARHDYARALEYYQLGLRCVYPALAADPAVNPSRDDLKKSANLEYLFTLITSKAMAWQALEKHHAKATFYARQGYLLADKLVDLLSWENFMTGSKLLWREKTHDLYDHAIGLCYEEKNAALAFYFFEKSRAVVLNERLQEVKVLSTGNRALLHELAAIRKKINQMRPVIGNPQANSATPRAQDEVVELQERYESLMGSVRKQNPYLFSNLLDTSVMDIHAIQQRLENGRQLLIETFVGNQAVYLMQVSGKSVSIRKIALSSYSRLVTEFMGYCADVKKMNQAFPAFCKTSYELYSLLFGAGPLQEERLVISPDGPFFPFEALRISGSLESSEYLLNSHAISYVYAARSLLTSTPDSAAVEGGFMGMAPVRFQGGLQLPELAGSDRSLESIGYAMGDKKMFTGAEATRSNFAANFFRYQCLQLYTHASDSSDRNEPVIFFADSAVYLSDLIPENDMKTRLVFLSACETGAGKLSKGEGVFSFNRGFAELGIPATISTLWPISNQSTYRLTELFYKYLSEGADKDISLQRAKLQFLKEAEGIEKLPYSWAAPVLVGDTGKLLFRSDHKKMIMVVSAMIIGIIAILLFMLQRQSAKFRV